MSERIRVGVVGTGQTAVATVGFLEAAYRSAATHAPVAVEES